MNDKITYFQNMKKALSFWPQQEETRQLLYQPDIYLDKWLATDKVQRYPTIALLLASCWLLWWPRSHNAVKTMSSVRIMVQDKNFMSKNFILTSFMLMSLKCKYLIIEETRYLLMYQQEVDDLCQSKKNYFLTSHHYRCFKI